MSEENIPRLARKLGIPKDKIPVLREALTHRTYAVEHHLAYDNQRLEFLGDAVLEIVHTEAEMLQKGIDGSGDFCGKRRPLLYLSGHFQPGRPPLFHFLFKLRPVRRERLFCRCDTKHQ